MLGEKLIEIKWPADSEAIKRCPIPTELQVRFGLHDAWITVPTEVSDWNWPE